MPALSQRDQVAEANAKLKARRLAREKLYEATKLYLMAYEGYSHGGIKNGRRNNLRDALRALEEANR